MQLYNNTIVILCRMTVYSGHVRKKKNNRNLLLDILLIRVGNVIIVARTVVDEGVFSTGRARDAAAVATDP